MTRWRDILPIHPAADLFPLLRPDELAVLAADIKKNGLREQPTIWHDVEAHKEYLLDGRNRLDAMELAGIEFIHEDRAGIHWHGINPATEYSLHEALDWSGGFPKSVTHPRRGPGPIALVISANIMRRHLTTVERTRIVAELLRVDPWRSDRQVARTVGVSHPTVGKVRRELEEAGDVVTVTTSTDTRGRAQPRTRASAKRLPHQARRAALRGRFKRQVGWQDSLTGTAPDSSEPQVRLRNGTVWGRSSVLRAFARDLRLLHMAWADAISDDAFRTSYGEVIVAIERALAPLNEGMPDGSGASADPQR